MKLTERVIRSLKAPETGYTIEWDREIRGFGARLTANGVVSFVLAYRIGTKQKVYTFGRFPEWSVTAARNEAIELRKQIREGKDPANEREQLRHAPTFSEVIDIYLGSEEFRRKRPRTQAEYRRMSEKFLIPKLGRMQLRSIQRRDVEALHGAMKDIPYQANRVITLVSRMFNYAIEQKLLEANPAKNIEHYPEEKRTRFLGQSDQTELARFTDALNAYEQQDPDHASAANAIRLLLLTGSRSGEVLQARWEHFNLRSDRPTWTKPSAHTKQKKTAIIPLSPPALAVLESMKPRSVGPLFLGRDGKKARVSLRRPWIQVLKVAGLVDVVEVGGKRGPLKRYKPTVRKHDLRHTFASHLVSNGFGLQVVGGLLGHTQASTTMRYAHLSDQSLRDAAGEFGKILEFATTAKRA